ncbi:hypothetical protein BJX68DRAFT_198158 [Aspergillus pseudodeflectus]|uniref:RING-type domain-containing protein n=1 Tax=Aspergillus pseudodeflectus TaxID=176178 RepID=A0ABR4JHQ8_9EURO
MPSRSKSQSSTTHRPHLSSIIKLDPEGEPFCAGFARSKGRRCCVRTNARGRKTALSLLDEGTADLHAGLCIDDILEDLAPHVLCTRWHQNQASSLVSTWQARVDRYLFSVSVPRSRSRSQNRYEGWTVAECLAEIERLTAKRAAELASTSRSSRAIPRTSHPAPVLSFDAGNGTSASTTSRTLQEQSATSVSRPASRTPEPSIPANPEPVRRIMSTLTSTGPVATPGATSTIPSRSSTQVLPSPPRPSPAPVARPRGVVRRPVQGECSICLDPLRKSNAPTVGETSNAHGDEASEDNNETDNEESEGDEREKEQAETDISWCKSQCGVNYHKKCIEKWLAEAHRTTCPTCRGNWKT